MKLREGKELPEVTVRAHARGTLSEEAKFSGRTH